jgi:hypothetical protein
MDFFDLPEEHCFVLLTSAVGLISSSLFAVVVTLVVHTLGKCKLRKIYLFN